MVRKQNQAAVQIVWVKISLKLGLTGKDWFVWLGKSEERVIFFGIGVTDQESQTSLF